MFLEQLLRNIDVLETANPFPAAFRASCSHAWMRWTASSRAAIQAASVLGSAILARGAELSFLGEGHLDVSSNLDPVGPDPRGRDRVDVCPCADPRRVLCHAGQIGTRAVCIVRPRNGSRTSDATLRAQHLDRAGATNAAQAYLDAAENLIQAFQFDDASPLIERALELPVPIRVCGSICSAPGVRRTACKVCRMTPCDEFKEAARSGRNR